MRKIVLLAIACVFLLCGCGKNSVNTSTENYTEQISSALNNSMPPDNMIDALSAIIKNKTTQKTEMTLYKDEQKIQLGMTRGAIEKILGQAIGEGVVANVIGKEGYGEYSCSYAEGVKVVYCGKYDKNGDLKNEFVYYVHSESPSICDSNGFTVGDSIDKITNHLFNAYGENYIYAKQNKCEYKVSWDKEGNVKIKDDYSNNYGSVTYYFNNAKTLSGLLIHTVQ